MANVWKSVTTAGGATVATATLIGVGALLWYERPDPRYPATRDEAEIRFALIERLAYKGWLYNEPFTNQVGYYPSRSFYTVADLDDPFASVPNSVATLCHWSRPFIALHPGDEPLGGLQSIRRPVDRYTNIEDIALAPYPDIVSSDDGLDYIGLDWWRTNMYADAAFAGDFGYLHTNATIGAESRTNAPFVPVGMDNPPYYMHMNMLWQIGRAVSAMRWNYSEISAMPFSNSSNADNSDWAWHGDWSAENGSFMGAVSEAIGSLAAAEVEDDAFTSNYVSFAVASETNPRYHYMRCAWRQLGAGEPYRWRVQMSEYVGFGKLLPIPVAFTTNNIKQVWLVEGVWRWYAAQSPPLYSWDEYDVIYHPELSLAEALKWQTHEVSSIETITNYPPATMYGISATNSKLFAEWGGRYTPAENYACVPGGNQLQNEWDGAKTAGWGFGRQAAFIEAKFECLTNLPVFWP